ncbi:MAG: hypothetical protein GX806_04025 [Lentisphaerae bacterium]|nr:hypothetical protein [Lentisphaerota bacterium]
MADQKKWGAEQEEMIGIQMGPMIDCTFLLLLYFVSVSTIDTMRISKQVELPAAHAGIKEKDESGRFIVDVEWDESQREAIFKLGMQTITDAYDLVPLIQKTARLYPRNFRVVLRVDRRVPYEFTQQVMAAVAHADIANMMISTQENDR